MANANEKATKTVVRQGRRPLPRSARAHVPASRPLTLGDLIAATMDNVGGRTDEARKVLSSNEMSAAIGRKLVFI